MTIDPVASFGVEQAAQRARLAELERVIARRQAVRGGVVTVTTDGSGQATITHGLAFTPSGVVATAQAGTSTQFRIDTITATSFRVTVWSTAGSLVVGSVTFAWLAFS
jgi:hypothetical protein